MKWLDKFRKADKYKTAGKPAPPETSETELHAETAASKPVAGSKTEANAAALVSRLSPREKEVFLRLLDGAKMKDIAAELNIKTSTVNGYCREIYKLLGVNSKSQLILRYSGCRKQNEQEGGG